jgi:ABC-type uncharacterized transport system substrate-binding protein
VVLQLRCVLIWLMLGWAAASAQAANTVTIVSSDTTAPYIDAAQALIGALERSGVTRYDMRQMSITEFESSLSANEPQNPAIVVALGSTATAALARSNLKSPILSVLIPRSSFERVLRAAGRNVSTQFTAIYLDQPLSRQVALIRLALPAASRLGVLWGPDSWVKSASLRTLVAANGLVLQEAGVEGQFDLFPDLKQVLTSSDVFLALADPMVFNSSTIQNILLSSFRAKVPMVAFSPAYMQAGALMSLYTTPVQAGVQAAELVLGVLQNRLLPGHGVEPNDFEISVNEHVARSFNLVLDGKALRLKLRQLEGQR